MDLITYALVKRLASSGGGAIGGDGVLIKLENSIKDVQVDIDKIKTDLVLPLAQGAVLAIQIGEQTFKPTENVLKLPLASGEVLGLVKSTPADSENSINKISVKEDGTMEVNSLSSDKLVAGEEVLIFNSNHNDYFN